MTLIAIDLSDSDYKKISKLAFEQNLSEAGWVYELIQEAISDEGW